MNDYFYKLITAEFNCNMFQTCFYVIEWKLWLLFSLAVKYNVITLILALNTFSLSRIQCSQNYWNDITPVCYVARNRNYTIVRTF